MIDMWKERQFPKLTRKNVKALFDHVYDVLGGIVDTRETSDSDVAAFLPVVISYAHFVMKERFQYVRMTNQHVGDALDHLDRNSEGFGCWLAMIIAIEELYGLSRGGFGDLLELLPRS